MREMNASWDAASRQFHFNRRTVVLLGTLLAAVGAGTLVVISPIIVVIAYVATLGAVAVASASARFMVVIGGGLLVMGSSSQLDTPKVAYLLFVAASTALAVAALVGETRRTHVAAMRPLLLASVTMVGAIALSLVVALSAETPVIDAIRDAAPYALLAVAPLLALNAATSRVGRHMDAVIVAGGIVASVGFAVEFAGRRGIVDLPFPSLGLPSGMLATLAFVAACAAILSRRPHRALWIMIAATVLILLLGTGTRSTLALLVGPVAMVFVHGQRLMRITRLIGAVAMVGLAVLSLGYLAAQSSLIDVARLAERLNSLLQLGSNLSADPSYIERTTQVGLAWSTFTSSPAVGVGLGFTFDVLRFGGQTVPAFTLDTSLSAAAKFGVIGMGLFGIATAAAVSFYRRLRNRLPEHVRLTFVGFAAVFLAFLPLGNPIEDKGFALAVAMLVAWALSSASTASVDLNAVAGIGPGTPGVLRE